MPLYRCWPYHSLRADICPNSCLYFTSLVLLIGSCWIGQGETHNAVQSRVLPDHPCYNFSVGNPFKQEIYSPRYPENYPNNTVCECLLKAPPGKVIEIDFNDKFEMEESPNCTHDVLEVHDGRGGHTPLLRLLCGTKFPAKLRSAGEYIWMRFKSDELLEYGGFLAFYKYYDKVDPSLVSDDRCWHEETDYEGIIGTANISSAYKNDIINRALPLKCMWVLNVTANHGTAIDFWNFNLDTPNECKKNSLIVYKDRTESKNIIHTFCGTTAKNFTQNSSVIYLYLQSDSQHLNSHFIIHYTAYRTVKSEAGCDPVTEFDCRDTTCVNINLKCNNRINCKYKTDEENCMQEEKKSILASTDVMVILLLGLILLFSICISMTVSCYRQWKEIQKRRQELAARRSVISGIDRVDSFKPEGMTNLSVTLGDEPDDNGCYVPEVDLSIFHKRSNGGNAILFDQETALLDKQPPVPSQRQETGRRSNVTPPLIHRPSVATIDSLQMNNRTNIQSNTLMTEEEEEAQDIFPPPPTRLQEIPDVRKYRVDANIHMKPNQKQRGFDSGKSAPDVIGRH